MDAAMSKTGAASHQQIRGEATPREDCPNCGTRFGLVDFYRVADVPVHSVLLMRTRQEAISYPKRDLVLALCQKCGFVLNRAFDPSIQEYSSDYEETQGFSETFNSFSHRLARDLVDRHSLAGKKILEIGCGKGEFLTHICELAQCSGIGIDPAYVPTRTRAKPSENVEFIQDFYTEKYAGLAADFVCCKMTLEHIHETGEFMRVVRRTIGDRPDTVVFFQVPDMLRVLEENAFWDIYYEHCSYFSADSLTYLFTTSGFDVADTWTDYDGQYLMIEAKPATSDTGVAPDLDVDYYEIEKRVARFTEQVALIRNRWSEYLRGMRAAGRRIALWGAGSKAVAFLTTLGVTDEIDCAVDINPNKHGTFLPGTGHPIVTPEALVELRPDTVIVMNPIYSDEIRTSLDGLSLDATLHPITAVPEPEMWQVESAG